MKEQLLQQREELNRLKLSELLPRHPLSDIKPILKSKLIKLITGPRRAGKSIYALQILHGKNFAYANFDDRKLLENFDEDAFAQALSEVYPDYEYLLLDEVQNLDGWDLWVEKLRRRGANLVITGSNSRLLSSEMATVLTGRYVEILILPFSMSEHFEYLKLSHSTKTPKEKAVFSNNADFYMRHGGFPELSKNPDLTTTYLGTLFDSIILKDVAQRYKVRNTEQLFSLADYLVSNYCNSLSFNQIAKELEMNSVNTVKKFCGYLSEPYLFFFLPRFNNKLTVMKKAPMKVYVVDNGIIMARSLETSSNSGRQLENMVFLELLRWSKRTPNSLCYYKTRNDREVDFVVRDGSKVSQLIQVSYSIAETKTRDREFMALYEAGLELNCDNLIVITWYDTQVVEFHDKTIQVMSVNDWFFQGQ